MVLALGSCIGSAQSTAVFPIIAVPAGQGSLLPMIPLFGRLAVARWLQGVMCFPDTLLPPPPPLALLRV